VECYIPLVTELGFDCSTLDEAEIYMISGSVVRDRWFENRTIEVEAVDKELAAMRSEPAMAELVRRMTEEEKLALRTRIISSNRWLADKLNPHKTKRHKA
jgi:hypothetical protein